MTSRLEKLQQLRRRLDHEIEQERTREACRPRAPRTLTPRETLALRGVTVHTVRSWATDHGVTVGAYGIVSDAVLQAYIDAHTPVAGEA